MAETIPKNVLNPTAGDSPTLLREVPPSEHWTEHRRGIVPQDDPPTQDNSKCFDARDRAPGAHDALGPDEGWSLWHALASPEVLDRLAAESASRTDELDAGLIDYRETDPCDVQTTHRLVLRLATLTDADRRAADTALWEHAGDAAAIVNLASDEALSADMRWHLLRGLLLEHAETARVTAAGVVYRIEPRNDYEPDEDVGRDDDPAMWGASDFDPFKRDPLDDEDDDDEL